MNLLSEKVAATAERLGLSKIDSPVFGRCPVGLRFEIGASDPFFNYRRKLLSKRYFRKAQQRAITLYQNSPGAFDTLLWLIYPDGQNSEEELLKRFCGLTALPPPQERYRETVQSEDGEPLEEVRFYWDLRESPADIEKLFEEILRTDFGGFRELQYWVYLINTEQDVLLNLYDDRGLDMAAASRETLAPLYKKFGDWILESDRDRIDAIFNNRKLRNRKFLTFAGFLLWVIPAIIAVLIFAGVMNRNQWFPYIYLFLALAQLLEGIDMCMHGRTKRGVWLFALAVVTFVLFFLLP